MEENLDQPQVIYTAPTPWYQRKILWVFALMLILFLVGFYLYKNYFVIVSPTSSPVSYLSSTVSPANPLIAKAKSIGYDIIWINPEDRTGRTVFYKERTKSEMDFREVGLVYSQASASASQKLISYIAGAFIDFQDIANSPDIYLDLINPRTGIALPKSRVILTKDSSAKTFFRVEDLSKNVTEGSLGILSDWSVDRLKKIIQKGDAVVISLISKDNSGKLVNQTDSQKELIGTMLLIRRFNGLLQVEKELQP